MMIDTDDIATWPAKLEQLAREAEPEELAKADELFAQYAEEHERQTGGFGFDCRRWGDYLTLYVERQGNLPGEYPWQREIERKASTSLNIGQAREILLVPGHCFDRRGSLSYTAMLARDGEQGGSMWGTGYGYNGPPEGYHYVVSPSHPYVARERPMIVMEKPDQKDRGRMFADSGYTVRHATENYPRPAKDDEIHFNWLGAKLYVPAGKGEGVLAQILREIARGYEPPRSDSGSARNGEDP